MNEETIAILSLNKILCKEENIGIPNSRRYVCEQLDFTSM